LVAEGGNGFTFDPHRPAELAARLRRLASDGGLLARLRDGARRTPVVTPARHAADVPAGYQEALDEGQSGRGPVPGVAGLLGLHHTLGRADELVRRTVGRDAATANAMRG